MNDLNIAIRILKKLMDQGKIDRETDPELFLELRNTEVRSFLAQFEEEMDFRIVEASRTFYMVPDSGNQLLGFTAKDIREWVASNARLPDSYLLVYISMFILYLFYGGHNRDPRQRDFIRISSLIELLDNRFALALENTEQTILEEERFSLNFIKIAELWDSKQGFEEKLRKTKAGTILNACRLLEREGLLRIIDDDREIRCTQKLDDLMLNYYLNDSRVEEINSLFASGGNGNAPD